MSTPKLFSEDQEKFIRQDFQIKGRILFPNLLKLKKKSKPEDRDVYDVMFAFRPEENAAVMGNLMNYFKQVDQIAHPGVNTQNIYFVNPLKASKVQGFPEYQKQNGQPNADYLAGHLWVNASTGRDIPPGVFKQSQMGLLRLTEADEAEVYSGRNAVISINFWPMLPKPGGQNQKRGYYCNVKAVLLLEGGEAVGGPAAVNPDEVFGSFLGQMGQVPNFGAPAQPQQHATNVGGFNYQQGGYQGQAPYQPTQNPALPPMGAPAPFPSMGNAPAQPATQQYGQMPHGAPTPGFPPVGHGQPAQNPAYPSSAPAWPPVGPNNFNPNGQ